MYDVLLWMTSASLVISLYIAFHVWRILGRIRKESSKSFEIATRIQEDWDKFAARQSETQQILSERYERFESSTRDRVDKFEKVATNTRERLLKLEQYLKEFFEVELKSVFDSFDKTVSSILEEMKAEMLRGIERIEDIQAFVDSKSFAQDRILEGEGSVYRLLADTSAKDREPSEEALPAETESRYNGESKGDRAEKPPYRLEPDEAE